MIRSGVWNTTSWPPVGSSAVTPTATSTVITTAPASSRTSRIPGCRASATVRLGRDPDRRHEDPSGERPSGPGLEAGLRPMEGDGEVRPDDGIRGVAGREVHRGGRVDREHGQPATARGADDLDRGPDRLTERAADAGPEQGVDDDRGPPDPLPQHRDVARHRRVHPGDVGETFEPV